MPLGSSSEAPVIRPGPSRRKKPLRGGGAEEAEWVGSVESAADETGMALPYPQPTEIDYSQSIERYIPCKASNINRSVMMS